ncbi:MAG: hypothetical protein PHU66_09320, partial [Bacteroidaceae bacterium]|nr:hypothetical protein [Bacteroidaceae bacterium]
MKKVLSVLLAGAMTASMAVSAFAADVTANKVYNDDGEDIVGNDKDVWGDVKAPFTTTDRNSITVDGVVPGITMYIPLAKNMSDKVTDSSVTKDDVAAALLKSEKVAEVSDLTKDKKYLDNDVKSLLTATAKEEKDLDISDVAKGLETKTIKSGDEITGDAPLILTFDGTNYKAEAVTLDGDNKVSTIPANPCDTGVNDSYYVVADSNALNTTITNLTKPTLTDTAYTKDSKYYQVKDSVTIDFTQEWKDATPSDKNVGLYDISWDSLSDKDMFKFDVDKDDGSKYVDDVDLVMDKKLGSLD